MRSGSLLRRGAWLLALTLGLSGGVGLSGCAGRKVKDDFEVRTKAAEAEALTREVDAPPISEGPYHIGLRLGPKALQALVIEAIAPRLKEASAASMGAAGGQLGELGDSVELSALTLKDVAIDFPGDTDGILRARITLDGRIGVKVKRLLEVVKSQAATRGGGAAGGAGGGGIALLNDLLGGSGGMLGGMAGGGRGGALADRLQARISDDEVRWIPFSPEVSVRVFLGAEMVDERPAMVMELREVERFGLGLQTPLQLEALTSLVEEAGRQRISAMLTNPAQNPEARKVIPLPDRAGKGELPIDLASIGLKVIPAGVNEPGELFLGILTNLNVAPAVTASNRGAALGEQGWGLVLGEGTLGLMMRTMARQGKIPLRFNKRQEADPEGDIVVDPEYISLDDYGFHLSSRIWNLSSPAFWRRFDLYGTFGVERGQLKPNIEKIEAGEEGEGNMWLGKMIEKKQEEASERSLKQAGKATKPTLPLPMTGGKRALVLEIGEAKTTEGLLTVMGTVSVQDAAPE